MVALGKEIMDSGGKTRASYYLSIPQLYQNNSWWSNQLMPCGHSGHTYGAVGCAMTSYAMVFSYYNNLSYTPIDIANTAQRLTPPCCKFGSEPLCQAYGHSRTIIESTKAKMEQGMVGALANGRPCVVCLVKNENPHFVVVKGYNDNGGTRIFNINDPQQPAYTTLQQFYNTGWELDFVSVIIR